MAAPSKQWYESMDRIHSKKYFRTVIRDISKSGIDEEIKEFRQSFIEFAALERMHCVADINKELSKYNARNRMYQSNVKEWYRILKKVFKRDNYTCVYCGKLGGKLEADHIVPFSNGGSDSLDNLVTACRRCNRQKKDKSVDEFLKWKCNNG